MTSLLDPEPCDDCDTGIQYLICFDGVRRCHSCVWAYAEKNGWNDLPDPPPAPAPAPEPPAPLSPAERKALREERRERDRDQQHLTFQK